MDEDFFYLSILVIDYLFKCGRLTLPRTVCSTSGGDPIVPFHKSQDTLLHPGLNDQIQNTLFTEDPHVTRTLWGWFD